MSRGGLAQLGAFSERLTDISRLDVFGRESRLKSVTAAGRVDHFFERQGGLGYGFAVSDGNAAGGTERQHDDARKSAGQFDKIWKLPGDAAEAVLLEDGYSRQESAPDNYHIYRMIFVSISLKYDEDNVIVEMGISVNDPFEENIDY